MSINQGVVSGNGQEVDSNNNAQVVSPGNTETGASRGGGNANAPAIITENDGGSRTSQRYTGTPEADADSRLRMANELWLDDEQFNYTAQNTGKHQVQNTTLTMGFTTGGMQTNSGNVTTTTTGVSIRSYAMFPIMGAGNSTYIQFRASLNAALNANQVIDFGLFQQPTSNPFAPTDGVYFRADSSGWKAVINNNGTEVEQLLNGTSGTGSFTHSNNVVYKFLIEVNESQCVFWINDTVYYKVSTPSAQGQVCLSAALPMGIRHAIVGGAGGTALQATFKKYSISLGGSNFAEKLSQRGNAIFGSYQGLSGGAMGQLVAGTVTTGTLVKPSAVVPTNTALTAGLGNSLGGRSWESYTTPLATNTDGIIAQYQVPAGTVSIQGKRLKIRGVKLSGVIQTAITGGPFTQEWYLTFGNTATSLQTAEAATTKAPRRVMIPEFTQNITATQAANTAIQQPSVYAAFDEPIYVNQGEFLSLVNNWFGTAPTAGTAAYTYQFVYSWE